MVDWSDVDVLLIFVKPGFDGHLVGDVLGVLGVRVSPKAIGGALRLAYMAFWDSGYERGKI